ncbi:MAG: alpha/beta fold hydrolase, partial [Hyphomicrobium sp.]|nr:alpha/beta fold hydrolase [Hyphomicrobium sp.]
MQRPDGNTVAYAKTEGSAPTVVFLGGFRSDMTGTKAVALEAWAREAGRAFLRFDYLGHGQSSGRFGDGTIGRWLDDSLAAIDQLTAGKLVLVGSSMGGWLSLLVACARPERLAGLVAPRIERDGGRLSDGPALAEVVKLLRDRATTLEHMAEAAM